MKVRIQREIQEAAMNPLLLRVLFFMAITASGQALAQEQSDPIKKEYSQMYSQAFKGKPADMQMYEMRGKKEGVQFLKYEPDGLRITLPSSYRGDNHGTGLSYNALIAL